MQITVSIVLILIVISIVHGGFPKDMSSMMNFNADPCTDFYEYACGGWIKSTNVHPSKPVSVSSYMALEAQNEKIYTEIIKKKHPLLNDMWESCINLGQRSTDDKLQKDLDRIRTAYTKQHLLLLAGEFSRTGTNIFIKFHVESIPIDDGLPPRNTVVVRPAELTLPDDLNHGAAFKFIEQQYRTYILDLFKLSGYLFLNEAQRQRAVDRVIHLEEKFASIHLMQKSDEIKQFKLSDVATKWPLTFGAFSKGLGLVEKSGWRNKHEEDLKRVGEIEAAVGNHEIYVASLNYMESVETLLNIISLDDFKVYLAFLMIHSRAQWLGTSYYDTWFKLFGKEIKDEHQPSRSKVCTDQLIEYLPDVFGKYFSNILVKRQGGRDSYIHVLSRFFIDAFRNRIDHSTWLDPQTEQMAQHKINIITPLVGHEIEPDFYHVKLSKTNYTFNVHSILSYRFDREMEDITRMVNKWKNMESTAIPVVKYIPQHNTIRVTSAILQPPFYHGPDTRSGRSGVMLYHGPKAHPARDFGGIGTMIARELIHSVDTIGRKYDENGYQHNWWMELTSKVYETRGKCMIRQYSRFEVVGENGRPLGNVNARKTLDENIADVGGLAIAWDAYRTYMMKKKDMIVQEWKPEDAEKMFFLSFGQNWCTKAGNTALTTMIATDRLAPAKWRVNGAVMNNHEFAKVFQCKSNVQMNPIEKCNLW